MVFCCGKDSTTNVLIDSYTKRDNQEPPGASENILSGAQAIESKATDAQKKTWTDNNLQQDTLNKITKVVESTPKIKTTTREMSSMPTTETQLEPETNVQNLIQFYSAVTSKYTNSESSLANGLPEALSDEAGIQLAISQLKIDEATLSLMVKILPTILNEIDVNINQQHYSQISEDFITQYYGNKHGSVNNISATLTF